MSIKSVNLESTQQAHLIVLGEIVMRFLKNIFVIASILGMMGALSACHHRHEPMKLGSVYTINQQVIPG